MASSVSINYPTTIQGVPIDPLWWTLVDLIHDNNFYYKDRYVFPVLAKPIMLYGAVSSDVVGVDIYRGSDIIPSEKIASLYPENNVISFLLPKCSVGSIELNARAYNSLNEEVARTRVYLLTTYWATLLWPFYCELRKEQTHIDRILHPRLSQDYIGVPDIEANFLTITKTPKVDWDNLDSARAVTKMALQGLYTGDITPKGLKDYIAAYFGSLPVIKDPTGWVLGGDDYSRSATLSGTVGASANLALPLQAYSMYSSMYESVVPTADYTVGGTGLVTVTSTAHIYPGCYPVFDLEVLDWTFLPGDYIALTRTATASSSVWDESSTSILTDSKIICGVNWAPSGGSILNTATSIASAWNTVITPNYFLTATVFEAPGRIKITGSGVDPSFFQDIGIIKGGSYPDLVMVKITRSKTNDISGSDVLNLSGLGNGQIQDYGSLFLGTTKGQQRHILEGTVSFTGNAQSYHESGSSIYINDYWKLDSYTVTDTFTSLDVVLDSDGSVVASGNSYYKLSYPILSSVSYDFGATSLVVVPPDIVDLGITPPSTGTITYYRVPTREAIDATQQVIPSFFSPSVTVESPYVGPNDESKCIYAVDITECATGGIIAYTSAGLVEDSGVWTRTKASTVLKDSNCGDRNIFVPSGIFEVGDIVIVGRDRVTISSLETIQYVGDELTLSSGLLEKHYARENIYAPDDVLSHSLYTSTPLDLYNPTASGVFFPPNKGVYLDVVDSRFDTTARTISISKSDSELSGWTSWEELPYPYLISPAMLDPMGQDLGGEYIAWHSSQGGGAYTVTTLAGSANTPTGHFPAGCLSIAGNSVANNIGVDKHFPQGCGLGSNISFWVQNTSGASGTCYLDLSTRVPMDSEGTVQLENSFAFSKPASGSWNQVNIDISTIPSSSLGSIKTVRFRIPIAGTVLVASMYPERYYRYFKVGFDILGSKGRTDYVLSRIGIKTVTDPKHPVFPTLTL